jgi:redox-sensitive bicupin YhaK (pirin superfamily)
MITLRRADDRGHAQHGWLDSRHTFSFADYYDPAHMGFRALRVINEDRVAPGKGFGAHSHRDMEIVSVVLEGALAHRDSMGNTARIAPGEVQRMTAGTGVTHSEFNASSAEPVHFLQIWLLPSRRGMAPGYDQKEFPTAARQGRLCLVGSPDGAEGSLVLHTDARLVRHGAGRGRARDAPPRAGPSRLGSCRAGIAAVGGGDAARGRRGRPVGRGRGHPGGRRRGRGAGV